MKLSKLSPWCLEAQKIFALQGAHVLPIATKFGTTELQHAKFHVDRIIFGDFWQKN